MMAEAPGPAGPPRKTQTLNKFSTMASQNQREGTKEDEFFWLENIMRVAPHKLHSVPGPRTIETYPIPSPPNTCPDDAPGAQALDQVCCYDNTLWVSPQGTASSLSHMPDDFTFWCTSSEQSGFPSSPYPVSSPQRWYIWTPTAPTGPSCALTDITSSAPLPFPHTITEISATQGAQAGRSGKSDENSYVLQVGGDLGHPYAAYFGESSGFTPTLDTYNCTHGGVGPWTKYGGFYWSNIWCIGSNQGYMKYWSVPGGVEQPTVATLWIGGVSDPSSPLPGVNSIDNILAMQATADALWVLKKAPTDTTAKLCKLDKTALTLTTEYTLSDGSWADLAYCFNFDIFSNNLFFLITKNTSGNTSGLTVFTIGWWKPLSNTFFVIGTFTTTCSLPYAAGVTSPSRTSAFFYKKNYFFVGGDSGNVLKLGPLVCPSNPNIPWEN